ncbi:hypothetical protein VitviT2T_005298 [Vitis vinifera]|uniref:Uncharacterized protein n=1 Tax=Vitis vinifera TaxID=29760 RepID=A0ABY9BSQ8_VITVI|nr:hypothetical protein VitviT2T_005298 [Vitis vinifera]
MKRVAIKNLKRELLQAQEEVKRIQSTPLVISQFMEMANQKYGIVGSTTELLEPSDSVTLHCHSNALVDVLSLDANSSILLLSQSEKPYVTYNDIEGW